MPVQRTLSIPNEPTQTDRGGVPQEHGATQQKVPMAALGEELNGQNFSFGESHQQIPVTGTSSTLDAKPNLNSKWQRRGQAAVRAHEHQSRTLITGV